MMSILTSGRLTTILILPFIFLQKPDLYDGPKENGSKLSYSHTYMIRTSEIKGLEQTECAPPKLDKILDGIETMRTSHAIISQVTTRTKE